MNFEELISIRKSTRKFTSQPVEAKKIQRLKETALLAPTGKRKNHWEFIIIENKETLKLLSECKPHGARMIKNSALSVVVLGNPSISDTWIEDCSIASIYLQLQAEELDLGSCWVQVDKREYNDQKMANEYIKNLLDIPEQLNILSVIAIGYPEQPNTKPQQPDLALQKIHHEKYSI